ncbi:MAG: glycosyltransferase [Saprospirales bacterium]|nr:MAG: glycosyltransferase [Saprospirales bacterium]
MLVITSRIPFPIEKGDKLRVFYQLKYLSKFHRISLVSLCENQNEIDVAKTILGKYCESLSFYILPKWKRYINLPFGMLNNLPFSVQYFYHSGIGKKIKKHILKLNPDHIYCQLIRTAPYVRKLPFTKTIDYMDSFSLGAKRRAYESSFFTKMLMRIEAAQLSNYESEVFNDFNSHSIISDQDKMSLKILSKEKISIIPNGVDTSFFYPNKSVEKKYDLLLCGNMGYYPNVLAAKVLFSLLDRIKIKFPDLKVLIAGARPHPSVRAMDGKNGITVSGWMDDIREAYWSSEINIAPIFTGSGLQNKMLEAMACGLPCLTTEVVADSIGGVDGCHYSVASNKTDLEVKLEELLTDALLRKKLGEGGLELVKSKFSWSSSVDELNRIINEGAKVDIFGVNL